ncbi:AAA family ATPase [Colletotrichum sojae]|uniref:AAA family ATPase n=1 Tax=Colletotrichum sojae TaxID=2175907 RepID=A0A8H6MN13_9PEZI|nr:AAA family ATPase [Colletotrichum sojae]
MAPDIGPDPAQPDPEEATAVKRFARVDEIYSLKDRQRHLIKTPKAPKVPSKAFRYAFLIKRHISLKGVVARISVGLNSSHLIRVLRDDVFAGIQSLGLDKQTPQLSRQDFWHAKTALTKRLASEKARQAKGKESSLESSKPDCNDDKSLAECVPADETPGQALVKDIQAALDFLDAFGKVLMPPTKRDLIRRLILAHRDVNSDKAASSNDIIKDKGESLIGLLSGDPGVGKTLTAEAVAEVSQRPLLSVGSGELGADLKDIDMQLKKWLILASAWHSVLLIDECDVFLRKRDQTSLVNNALVSIFLRRLECVLSIFSVPVKTALILTARRYFKGVAILATNRKTDIDSAFMSRIHFKFHFDNLGSKERSELWKTFAGEGVHLDEAKLAVLAKELELNGREIRNVVFCAKRLSKTEDPPSELTVDLLTRVAKDLTDFRET